MDARLCLLALVFASQVSHATEEIPRSEHPDPSSVREHWKNLNGTWNFRFDPKNQGLDALWFQDGKTAFEQSITVPFGWESRLSGVQDTSGKSKIGWYRRQFRIPESFPPGLHIWLRFGAVDWRADVWVNGQKAVAHEGGYSPFEADITDLIRRDVENSVVVRAFDPTDPNLPTGKQVGWYTPTSGIWQTVWLEARPSTYLSVHKVDTKINPPQAIFHTKVQTDRNESRSFHISIRSDDDTISLLESSLKPGNANTQLHTATVAVRNPQLWSAENPHLYPVTLELKDDTGRVVDTVQTYFGLRTISRGTYGNESFERVLLNGKPVYLRLALDQSFNPDGLYTAPSDEFLRKDLELAKATGLNGIRIHIKPEEPRRLYWADRLGLLVMEDMPNTWQQNPRARAAWEQTMHETILRDRNHPSIFSWVAFNETWGLGSPPDYKADRDTQAWVKRMVQEIKSLDSSRLVEDNSPCNFDHVNATDLNSWHFYIDDFAAARSHIEDVVNRSVPGSSFNYCPEERMNSAPLINSEYGAVSAGSGDRDISWGFRDLTTQLRKHPKIQGYVYTELTDIEWEHNGFANYDRTPKVFGFEAFVPKMTLADLQGSDFVGYNSPPIIVARPGEKISVPVFVSHYSNRVDAPTLRWWVTGVNEKGLRDEQKMPDLPTTWEPYTVTSQPTPLEFKLNGPFVGAVGFELVDSTGKRMAANFVNVVIKPVNPVARVERLDDHRVAIRFSPEDFSEQEWSKGRRRVAGKASGLGTGQFTYKLALPESVRMAKPLKVQSRFELAARAGTAKVDWPARLNPQDYPQTDQRQWPSAVEIGFGEDKARVISLPDDPADARGVLSHLSELDHGSYGYRVEFEAELSQTLRNELNAGNPLPVRFSVPSEGGLTIFGEDTGAFPFAPTLILTTEQALPTQLGVPEFDSLTVDLASSRLQVLIPFVEANSKEPALWRFNTVRAPAGWEQPGFNDSAWQTGPAGFGTPGTPGVDVHTNWQTSHIYLRKNVELAALNPRDEVCLGLIHDEDAKIYINGTLLHQAGGYITSPVTLVLSAQQKALFVPGRNTIAVECHNTRGGQGIDLGLWIQKAR